MHETGREAGLLRQQEALARFGELALRSDSIDEILAEAARLVRDALRADFAKVMELQPDGRTLLVRAGVGWPEGVVGQVRVQAEIGSSEGYALRTGDAAISPDIALEDRFTYPDFIRDAGVRALVNVVILGTDHRPPYGLLQVDSRRPRAFSEHDISFLRGYATLIAGAVHRLHVAAERRRAEEALRESEDHHRASVELNPQIPWTADADGRITGFSQRWLELTGQTQEAALQDGWLRTPHPDDRARIQAAWRRAVAEGTAFDAEARFHTASGAWRWLRARAAPRRGAAKEVMGWYGTLEDIEDRKRLETALHLWNDALEKRVAERTAALQSEQQERAAAEEKLRQAQKMEAVGQLTGGIAHDFNNLLTAIIGSLGLLERRRIEGRFGDFDRYITTAQSAATRAAALTHRLLAFSRRQTLDARPTDLGALVRGMEDMIRRTVGPAVQLEVAASPGLWATLLDRNQMENALLNLCINARDAMPEGGRLSIATANARLDARAAAARDLAAGDYLMLAVADTGAGMPPDVVARAFDPFFTTKPLGKGTGLGLSMIYGFVRQSGGQVRIVSAPGQGTTVCIHLPRHAGASAPATAPRASPPPGRAEPGATVLLVDDEATLRSLMTEVLEELGCTVLAAADGAAGLALLRSAARLDLLVTDVGLPGGMNGRQVAEAARLLRPGLRVLFITGYAEAAAIGNVPLAIDMQLMTKPFTMADLARRIRGMIAQPQALKPPSQPA
ncbi:ATP-binding protein [Falsiroseomonas selenitidurans]|uniref:histidine kinase n=1 Tax=Falsiroseomonas selenitidurans TaxID=2716335 RepID=A0ABX1DYX8_9PROT|nr:ATP-binding protein [Falsiroseomonas selenitidurans]NKC30110.1 PAS domain S-box protein [Falsiroseomonas selenitidurans]